MAGRAGRPGTTESNGSGPAFRPTPGHEGAQPVLFDWTHWSVGAELLAGRGFWLAVAMIALLAAAPLLDRFAAHRGSKRATSTEGRDLRWLDTVMAPLQRTALGALVLNAMVDPALTLAGHAMALPLALMVLVLAWRPLVARAR